MPGYDGNGMLDIADRSTTAESRQADPWTSDERHAYVKSLGIAAGPNEQAVLLLLEDAVSDAPLPPPWVMCRDEAGQAFWWDQVNHESVWKHPLEPALRELAGVCQACLSLDQKGREPCLISLKRAWEQEAKSSLDKWCRTHDQDREYFCHGESKEVTWTHPGERILPAFYMKMKVLERLREEEDKEPNLQLETTLPPTGSSQSSTLESAVRKEALPGGFSASQTSGDKGTKGTGGWWWACSPIKYMDDEASDRAYEKGATAGRQLCNELTATRTNNLKRTQGGNKSAATA